VVIERHGEPDPPDDLIDFVAAVRDRQR